MYLLQSVHMLFHDQQLLSINFGNSLASEQSSGTTHRVHTACHAAAPVSTPLEQMIGVTLPQFPGNLHKAIAHKDDTH